MNKIIIMALFVCSLSYAGDLFVETLDEQSSSKNFLVFRFRINNGGGVLHNAELRYFMGKSPAKQINIQSYYVGSAKISLNETDSANAVLSVFLDSIPQGVSPDDAGYSIGIGYVDWSNRDKGMDFSRPASNSFTRAENIALYADGKLIYGNEVVEDWSLSTGEILSVDSIATDTVAEGDYLEDASPMGLPNGIGVVLEKDRPMRFLWQRNLEANLYKLTILSAVDSSLVFENTYATNLADVQLPPGEYLWRVQCANSVKNFKPKQIDSDSIVVKFSLFSYIKVIAESVGYSEYVRIGMTSTIMDTIVPLNGRKDTKLLNVSWGELADIKGWDVEHSEPDPYTRPLDEDEGYRCWAVVLLDLNHYYTTKDGVHGNLALDEIMAKVKLHTDTTTFDDDDCKAQRGKGPVLAPFHYLNGNGGCKPDISYGISYVLNVDTPRLIRPGRDISLDSAAITNKWMSMIQNQKPIYIALTGHAMLIDGYRINILGNVEFHFLNRDNYGTAAWMTFASPWVAPMLSSTVFEAIEYFAEFDIPTDVALTNPEVHTDTDLDGIMDFDEKYRFKTDFTNPDTDGDGIDDKTEIHSYTIREVKSYENTGRLMTTRGEILADVDGDGLRAELDVDSDNDGILDGDEDLNHNGYVDDGETDPYAVDFLNAGDDYDLPENGNIALYALDFLRLNDGVACGILSTGCNIAAEQAGNGSIVLGVGVSVGNIHSKGQVWLRNNAKAWNVHFYGLPDASLTTEKQDGATITGEFNLMTAQWPWTIPQLMQKTNTSEKDFVVRSGDIYILKDGDAFRNLKVESGGILYISTGVMVVDKLQIDSGADVLFMEPGYRTVLHVNESVLWNARVNNKETENVEGGFKMIYYGSGTFDVAGTWRGTLIAPNAKVILGQGSNKVVYGRFLAKQIVVHQYTKIRQVKFAPKTAVATEEIVWRR